MEKAEDLPSALASHFPRPKVGYNKNVAKYLAFNSSS